MTHRKQTATGVAAIAAALAASTLALAAGGPRARAASSSPRSAQMSGPLAAGGPRARGASSSPPSGEASALGRVAVTVPAGDPVVAPFSGGDIQIYSGPASLAATAAGGLVAAGTGADGHPAVVALTASGAPDAGFGDGGTVELAALLARGFVALQVLARPDGGVVVVGATSAHASTVELIGLLADGAVDGTFGSSGRVSLSWLRSPVVDPGSGQSPPQEGADIAALEPDGDVVLAGTTSAPLGSIGPGAFVVVAVTPAGRLDPAFAAGGVAAFGHGEGLQAQALAGGAVAALGILDATAPAGTLVELTPAGTPLRAFAGGRPATVAGTSRPYQLLAAGNGALLVFDGTAVARYTPAGRPDAAFGVDGEAALRASRTEGSRLVALRDGGLLAVAASLLFPPQVRVTAITAAGLVPPGATHTLTPAFSFGGADDCGQAVDGPAQGAPGAFGATGLVTGQLADGSLVLASPVEDDACNATSVNAWGFAALTPGLRPDAAFGARAPLRLSAGLAAPGGSQPAAQLPWTAPACPRGAHEGASVTPSTGLDLTISSSAAAIAAITVSHAGRVLAHTMTGVPSTTGSQECVPLTPAALNGLPPSGSLPVTVAVRGRDLAGNSATVTRAATLPVAALLAGAVRGRAIALLSGFPRGTAGPFVVQPVGSSLRETTTLRGAVHPGGTLTFYLAPYGSPSCGLQDPIYVSTVRVSGDGRYVSGSFTPRGPGDFAWSVLYSGDARNAPALAWCATPEVVGPLGGQ